MLYFYEAMVLVFSSALLGVMVGMTIGYTMTLSFTQGGQLTWGRHSNRGSSSE